MQKVILFELNEVPFRIVDWFVARHPRSAFAELLRGARAFTTVAEDEGHLSPWTTWPTVHRGVTDAKHGLAHLGQILEDVDRDYPPVWRILRACGRSVGVCGSLHSRAVPADMSTYAFYLPDTFADVPDAHPAKLAVFQAFNLKMVARSQRNVSTELPIKDGWALLKRRGDLGLRWRTLADIARHVTAERLKPALKCRRRTYQSVLCFDVFERSLRETRPDFATFFTNHVASALHRFWAATFPQDYEKLDLDTAWTAAYRNEIEFSMKKADAFLKRVLRFMKSDGGYLLVLASSMGQAATNARVRGRYLAITNLSRMMSSFGFTPEQWKRQPAMAPDVCFRVEPAIAGELRRKLEPIQRALPLHEGEPSLSVKVQDDGFVRLHLALENAPASIAVDGRALAFADLGLGFMEDDEAVSSTAYHTPEGILVVYGPGVVPSTDRPPVSTIDVAPSVLRHFDVPVPAYMTGDATLLEPARVSARTVPLP